jgi:hypothetical protein
MLVIVHLLGSYVADLFKSRHRLEIENLCVPKIRFCNIGGEGRGEQAAM